jgi:hypothetical protein
MAPSFLRFNILVASSVSFPFFAALEDRIFMKPLPSSSLCTYTKSMCVQKTGTKLKMQISNSSTRISNLTPQHQYEPVMVSWTAVAWRRLNSVLRYEVPSARHKSESCNKGLHCKYGQTEDQTYDSKTASNNLNLFIQIHIVTICVILQKRRSSWSTF